MHLSDDFRIWCIQVVRSTLFQQTAPLVVLIVIPVLFFFLYQTIQRTLSPLYYKATMGLEAIGVSLPAWFWGGNGASATTRTQTQEKKKLKKQIRTRAEQVAMNGKEKADIPASGSDDGYYPGLVNISGTYCFMNSTLQALASLTYLQPHIDAIHTKAEALDVPTPVIDALQDLFRQLNTPRSAYHSLRPTDMIAVLSAQTEGRTNSLFYSREHQDAQELFQVISECIKNELVAVDKEGHRDRGLVGITDNGETMREIGKSVFDGLTANRRSCVVCGYTEAVMHFAFDNWQLAVPRLAASCRLEDCLEDYTRLEILKDCICRKCSILATHRRLQAEVLTLEEATKPDARPSSSKKRRLKEVKRMEAKVKQAVQEGRIEDELKDVRMEKVFSPASTKQAMIARPPPALALHINRSHYGQYASKNGIRVLFPEVLDLTPYTTSGSLSTVPTAAISTPPPMLPRSTTPTPERYANQRTIYRLASIVCHYGQHSFGHYVCFRRKPRPGRWAPPRLVDPLGLSASIKSEEGEDLSTEAPRYVFDDSSEERPGKGWLRISDDSVRECGIESVLAEGSGVFMLYYERAIQEGLNAYREQGANYSEETLKPEMRVMQLNGSVGSLVSELGVGVKEEERERERLSRSVSIGSRSGPSGSGTGLSVSPGMGPRVVRSVAAGRGRTPSEREGSVMSVSPSDSMLSGLSSSSLPKASHILSNGDARRPREPSIPPSMSASAPSIISTSKSSSSTTSSATVTATTSSSSKSSSTTSTASTSHSHSHHSKSHRKHPPPPRMHSPQPHHPPSNQNSVVGLKA